MPPAIWYRIISVIDFIVFIVACEFRCYADKEFKIDPGIGRDSTDT